MSDAPCPHYICDEEGPFMPEVMHCEGCCEIAVAALRSHAEALAKALGLFVQGVDEFWSVPGCAKEALEKARAALSAYREGQKGQP